ncbi:uncharacterized protein LOC130648805 [Hydractinia symbiolongicarpus]|uniref:uncharacterized protein LOC130648805 n=1 Tax=Hydractinia symbiolongicarpus TaxID=13093 RepID=UPI00254EAEF6|nr:uncharacterized protein LOC130648805 [Hydractinia symbiolongicarpus]
MENHCGNAQNGLYTSNILLFHYATREKVEQFEAGKLIDAYQERGSYWTPMPPLMYDKMTIAQKYWGPKGKITDSDDKNNDRVESFVQVQVPMEDKNFEETDEKEMIVYFYKGKINLKNFNHMIKPCDKFDASKYLIDLHGELDASDFAWMVDTDDEDDEKEEEEEESENGESNK